MLLGLTVTLLSIWLVLLIGETVIWSDKFRDVPKITIIRFMWIYAEVLMMCLSALVGIFSLLFMDVFTSVAPYIFVGAVLILVFWSYFKNFKNKFVQILMLSFFVDIIIHCVLKFGLHTSYIYGGHFIFVVPMMLGWLFFGYKNSPKM